MDPGYELVKQQLFFRKELMERIPWLIKLRWIVVVSGLAACLIGYFFFELSILPFILILACIFFYNLVFQVVWKRISPASKFNLFAHVQISCDLLALYLAIYFTGGIQSPLCLFVIFHVIIAGILLPPASCYFYGILILSLLGLIIFLQQWGFIPVYHFRLHNVSYGFEPTDDFIRYLTLSTVLLITAFLVTTIKLGLRTKGRDILNQAKSLDESNTKLTALYEMVKEMGMCTESRALMDSATRWASRIMGVKACSIKLLDSQKQKLNFASTYGLSRDYIMSKESIDLQKSHINRKIIEGSSYTIGHIEEADYFQYPEDIRKEGILSMLCLPLRVEKMVLGVFCVYSDAYYSFADKDVQFFSLIADLAALEIEKLNSDINRIWFLQKAAHQLRSPMHAVVSMLKLMKKGYLGPINFQQEETTGRCVTRLEMLDNLIGDLLRLSMRRTALTTDMNPTQASAILQNVSGLFKAQAREKSVEFVIEIDENLPAVMATEQLIDELFSNLISNAIKYTPSGGKVTASLSREEDKIRFEVSDTGIGIPEEAFHKLFSEFFRADNAKEFSEAGTGLGLVIAKEILDCLKGVISVRSQVGKGTTFICHLPSVTGG